MHDESTPPAREGRPQALDDSCATYARRLAKRRHHLSSAATTAGTVQQWMPICECFRSLRSALSPPSATSAAPHRIPLPWQRSYKLAQHECATIACRSRCARAHVLRAPAGLRRPHAPWGVTTQHRTCHNTHETDDHTHGPAHMLFCTPPVLQQRTIRRQCTLAPLHLKGLYGREPETCTSPHAGVRT
jgi:hypothetical protein